MSTNKSKLVNWNADFYNSLPDEFCYLCLSKKHVYLLGQTVEQIKWSTRWFGDTSGMDIKAIAADLESRIAMDECGNLNDLMNIIISMQNDINVLIGVTENPITDTPYTVDSTPNDAQYYDTLTEPISSSPCSTNADRDKLYGGVLSLADYIIANTTDFLEILEQNFANPPELVENLVEAIPAFGLLPLDDMVEYAGWLIDQFLDAWTAVVTEELKQEFYCDLFCLAIDHNCTLTLDLLLGYCNSKMPETVSGIFKMSIKQAISFVVTGNFIGSDYFYIGIGLQLSIIAMGQKWIGTRGWKPYQYRFLAGKLEPNNGHEVFCIECPEYYSYIEYDFTISSHGFVSTNGTWVQGTGWVADVTEPSPGDYRATMTISKEFTGDLPVGFAGGMVYDALSNCGIEGHSWAYFLDNVQEGGGSIGGINNGDNNRIVWSNSSANPPVSEQFDEVRFFVNAACCGCGEGKAIIKKARIWLSQTSPVLGIPSNPTPIGLGANGSSSVLYWGGI